MVLDLDVFRGPTLAWCLAKVTKKKGVFGITKQEQVMIPPHNSLVKYDNPVLVSTTGNRSGKAAKKKGPAPPVDRQSSQTEDILNSILPPRCVYLSQLRA